MDALTLLFDHTCAHLGELKTEEGALKGFVLTKEGEMLLGRSIQEWQTRGILDLHDMVRETKDRTSYILVESHIPPRHRGFLTAFRHWAVEQRMPLITVPPPALPCWEKMLRLPLGPVERYSMMSAACRLSEQDVPSWLKALDEAAKAVERV